MLELIDTHCHIQSLAAEAGEAHTRSLWEKAGDLGVDTVLSNAKTAGVSRMICVGCDLDDSELAIQFVQDKAECFASIGIHPHEAKSYAGDAERLEKFSSLATRPKVVAVGECGLDFYYNHSPKSEQIEILRFQLQIAQKHGLPVIFHVRDAFDEFWPIFDEFKGIRGVIHSFTADISVLEQILTRGLYVGLNGIMTFTKDLRQLDAAKALPLQNLLLETDAPFLTPSPYRGTICEPKHVMNTAEFLADLRGEELDQLAAASTYNAKQLFAIG